MSYSPINVATYTAAFSGAVAGMGVSGWITDQNSTDYTNVTLIAGAFAQAFDQVWNNATQLNNLELAAITATVQTDFTGRGPGPFNNPTFQDPNNWTQSAGACAALVLESDIFFTNENINPGLSYTIEYPAIGNGSSDTLAIQATMIKAANEGAAVEFVGQKTIELLDAGNIGRTIPSFTRLTTSPGVKVHLDQPLRYAMYSAADGEVPLGNIATTQTICTVAITNALLSNPSIGDTLFLHVTDNGGMYDVESLGEAVIGTTDVTTAGLYGGSSTLNGLTLILNIDGAGNNTLVLNKSTNVASEKAFLAAIIVKWPTLTVCIADSASKHLTLAALVSISVGSGTANTLLGLVAGPNTNLAINVDRPIIWPLPIGALVTWYQNPPIDIDVDLRDSQWDGACGQVFEVTAGKRYSLRNLTHHYAATDPFPATGVHTVCALDIGCRSSEIIGVDARNDNHHIGSVYFGFYGQANENCLLQNCRFNGYGGQGYSWTDSYNCRSINNWTIKCGYAHVINGDFSQGPTFGCIDCSIEGGGDIGSQYSLWIVNAVRSKVVNFSSVSAVIYGAFIDVFAGDITADTTLIGCSFVNAPVGIYVQSGATGTKCYSLNTDNCQNGIVCAGSIEVYGWKMHTNQTDATYILGTFNGSGPNVITGIDLLRPSGAIGIGISIGSSGPTKLSGGTITVGAADVCLFMHGTGTVYIDNLKLTGAYGIQADSGVIIVGPNCDFSDCSTGAVIPGGAGIVIWMNQGGLLSLSLAGFPSYGLTASQLAHTCIELNGLLGADTVVHFTQNIGEEWTITNNTTGAHTLTLIESPGVGSGVILAQTKTTIVRIASNGALAQVTAPL